MRNFFLKYDNDKLWVEVIGITTFDAVTTVDALKAGTIMK